MLNTNNQNNIPQASQLLQQRIRDRQLYENFVNKPEHITCDAPKGSLVKENLAHQFGATFTDTFQDAKNLSSALSTGKSNDHSLGRMNDLGMKIGGGLIAAALMGTKAATNKKLMEVLGFGTFFSVMSLWPKVAIDLPTKLRFGFNPHQKYIDSQGRKKAFFLDNQYLPWDVWSKEDIEKVADKMKVPKDLKDREEFTKEKMRTIALQGNTLWMLTAGFATPLLTSLCCNRIEELIKAPSNKLNLAMISMGYKSDDWSAKNIFSAFNNMGRFKNQNKEFNALIKELEEGRMPQDLTKKLDKLFNLHNYVNFSLENELSKEFVGTSDLVGKLFNKSELVFEDSNLIKHIAKGESPETVSQILGELNSVKKSLIDAGETPSLHKIITDITNKRGAFFTLEGQPEWVKKLVGLTEEEVSGFAKQASKFSKDDLSHGAEILRNIYSHGVIPAQKEMRRFAKNVQLLNSMSGEKYNKVLNIVIKAMGISDKELKKINISHEAHGYHIQELFTQKIQELVKEGNEAKYEKFIKKLDKAINSLDKGSTKDSAEGAISKTFTKVADKLRTRLAALTTKIGANENEALKGTRLGAFMSERGLSELEEMAAKRNITSVEATIAGIRSAFELEKRIENGSFLKDWQEAIKNVDNIGEIKGGTEGLYKAARKLMWQSTFNDLMNKGHIKGNGAFYKAIVETVFSEQSDNIDVKAWQAQTKKILFGEEYIPNPSLKFLPTQIKPNGDKFAEFGESLLSAGKKRVDQICNDRRWMKVFGGITAALVGVTFISQLFFGKVKDENLYEKKTNQDNIEGRK